MQGYKIFGKPKETFLSSLKSIAVFAAVNQSTFKAFYVDRQLIFIFDVICMQISRKLRYLYDCLCSVIPFAGVQIAYFAIIGTQMSMILLSVVLIFGICRVSLVVWLRAFWHFRKFNKRLSGKQAPQRTQPHTQCLPTPHTHTDIWHTHSSQIAQIMRILWLWLNCLPNRPNKAHSNVNYTPVQP